MVQCLLTEYVIPTLIEHLLCVKHSSKCFPGNISFNNHNPFISTVEIKETEAQNGLVICTNSHYKWHNCDSNP